MSYNDIWNIKAELEPAIANALNTGSVVTTLTAQDQQTFQKARARVEVYFVLGTGKDKHLARTDYTTLGDDVEDAWTGTVHVVVMSESDAKTHGQYEAYCRYVMHTLPSRINNQPGGIVNHEIYGPVLHLGSSPLLIPEQGIYKTEMQFGLVVSINKGAWALLNT